MKTTNGILVVGTFLLATSFAIAQNVTSKISRPVSKEIQKIANKTWLTNESLLTVKSVGYPSMFFKGVALTHSQIIKEQSSGNMISYGYPVWTISKGIHQKAKPILSEKKYELQNVDNVFVKM